VFWPVLSLRAKEDSQSVSTGTSTPLCRGCDCGNIWLALQIGDPFGRAYQSVVRGRLPSIALVLIVELVRLQLNGVQPEEFAALVCLEGVQERDFWTLAHHMQAGYV